MRLAILGKITNYRFNHLLFESGDQSVKRYDIKPSHIKKVENTNKENQDNQRDKLLERMRAKEKNRAKSEGSKGSSDSIKKDNKKILDQSKQDEIVRLNNQISKLKRELNNCKKEAAIERKKCRIAKSNLKELEKASSERINDVLKEADDIRKQARHELEEATQLLEELQAAGWDRDNDSIKELELRNEAILFLIHERIKNSKYVSKVQNREQNINKKVRNIEKELSDLKDSKIEYQKIVARKDRQFEKLQKEKDSLQARYNKLQKSIHRLKSTNAQDVIPKLIQQLDSRTFRSFNQLNTLFEKYQWTFKYNSQKPSDNKSDVLYGFLEVRKGDALYFHDINNEIMLPITVHKGFKRKDLLIDGMAIQVFRKLENPDSVSLGYCYPIVEKTNSSKKNQKEKTELRAGKEINHPFANEKVQKWAAEISILVVGNKHVKAFVNQLAKYVKSIEYIDAYEKGEKYTFERIRSVDYSFIMLDSVPHTISTFIKTFDPLEKKIQIFKLANEEDGLIRLNYLYWNQEEDEQKI